MDTLKGKIEQHNFGAQPGEIQHVKNALKSWFFPVVPPLAELFVFRDPEGNLLGVDVTPSGPIRFPAEMMVDLADFFEALVMESPLLDTQVGEVS